jgi:hypothetical protein
MTSPLPALNEAGRRAAGARPHHPCQVCLAGAARGRQNRDMKRATGIQGTLFGAATPSRPARPRQPPRQITVTICPEAIAAMTRGRIAGERIIVEAVHAARPDVRNIALNLGTIRRTDPKTSRRVTFKGPPARRMPSESGEKIML